MNLVIGHFVYMCYCKIQFYDKILKIGHKGQRSRSISIIFDIPTLKQKLNAMSNGGIPVTLYF